MVLYQNHRPFLVRVTGVEPARLSAREPKSRMSANSIIPADVQLLGVHPDKIQHIRVKVKQKQRKIIRIPVKQLTVIRGVDRVRVPVMEQVAAVCYLGDAYLVVKAAVDHMLHVIAQRKRRPRLNALKRRVRNIRAIKADKKHSVTVEAAVAVLRGNDLGFRNVNSAEAINIVLIIAFATADKQQRKTDKKCAQLFHGKTPDTLLTHNSTI